MLLQVGRQEEASGWLGCSEEMGVLQLHIPVSLDCKWQGSSQSMNSS